jgi:thioredoxin 1
LRFIFFVIYIRTSYVITKKILEKYQIRGLAQFVLIENGKEIKRFAGAMTMTDLTRFCDKKQC